MRAAATVITLALAASLLAGCGGGTPARQPDGGGGTPQESPGATPPQGSGEGSPSQGSTAQGEVLVQERCTQCHSLDRVNAAEKDKAGWESTVERMRQNGAQLTDGETREVVDFLAAGGAQQL
jgi:hypothetical protein